MAVEDTTESSAPTTSRRTVPTLTEQLIEPLSRLRGEVDRLFDDFPLRLPSFRWAGGVGMTAPALEMTETRNAYKITAELPGIDPSAVEVSVDNGMLRIAGEKRDERDEEEQGRRISERSYGAFERMISLPDDVKTDEIEARCRNGVLTISIPRDEKAVTSVRKIAVQQS